MTLRLLVALDGSETSARAAEHVGRVVGAGGDYSIRLFHACAEPPDLLESGGSEDPAREQLLEAELRRRREEWLEECRERVDREVFDPARRVLLEAGVNEASIDIRTRLATQPHPDVARAILEEADAAQADVVVVGRRGLSAFGAFVLGSVSWKVVHHLRGKAVWVVE